MKIESGRRVKMEYTLTLDGNVIESSDEKGPLEFKVGSGEVPIAELEEQLMGLKEGDEKEGAFPLPGEHPKETLPRANFPEGAKLEPGEAFEAHRPDGAPVVFKVAEVSGDQVTVEIIPRMVYKVKILEVTKF